MSTGVTFGYVHIHCTVSRTQQGTRHKCPRHNDSIAVFLHMMLLPRPCAAPVPEYKLRQMAAKQAKIPSIVSRQQAVLLLLLSLRLAEVVETEAYMSKTTS